MSASETRMTGPDNARSVLERMALNAAARTPDSEERERKAAEELAAFKRRVWRDLVAEAAPVCAADNAFSPTATPAVKAVNSWVKAGCPHALMLRGGVGVGKTTAACVAVKHWVEPRCFMSDCGPHVDPVTSTPRVTWLRPDELVSAVLHAYDPRAPRLLKYVVIDDMGTETRPEFGGALCELFERRGHTILITTNLTREQLRKRYTDIRLRDRLNDRARAFDVPGESLRKNNGDF